MSNGSAMERRENGTGMAVEIATGFNQRHIDIIKRMYAPNATADEFTVFLALCQRDNLDPLKKEAFFIKYDGELIMMTSRDGYLKICLSDPLFRGISSMAVRENDFFEMDQINGVVKHRFGNPRGEIIGAYAVAQHQMRNPIVTWADFAEYGKSKGPKTPWAKYPSAMICKVAEVMALKRIGGISGWVTREEMDDSPPIEGNFREVSPSFPEPPRTGPLPPSPTAAQLQSAAAEPAMEGPAGATGTAGPVRIASKSEVDKFVVFLKGVFKQTEVVKAFLARELPYTWNAIPHDEMEDVAEDLKNGVFDLETSDRIPQHVLNPDPTVDTATGEVFDADYDPFETEDMPPAAGEPNPVELRKECGEMAKRLWPLQNDMITETQEIRETLGLPAVLGDLSISELLIYRDHLRGMVTHKGIK